MKILLIEDEILIQKSLKRFMEKRGAFVTATGSGLMAIELLKDHHYDKIICDLMLSDTSGFDVLEQSKSYISSEDIRKKFIIITAYSSEEVLDKAERYGCKVFQKPFENLEEVINHFLSSGSVCEGRNNT